MGGRSGEGLVLSAPAKLNLFLRVVGRLPNGYHRLYTLFHKIDLADRVEIHLETGRGGAIALGVTGPGADHCPADHTNLAWRAAELILAQLGLEARVYLSVEKEIPVGAGLGGGSSDGAAVLVGLNRLLGNPLSLEELCRLALRLGADCPFFVRPEVSALGRGVGEELTPVELPERWFLVVKPPVSISTGEVYGRFRLTSPDGATIFRAESDLDPQGWRNDLEAVVFPHWPQVEAAKDALLRAGAERALMTGSGSAVFGLFPTEARARAAAQAMDRRWWRRVVRSLPPG